MAFWILYSYFIFLWLKLVCFCHALQRTCLIFNLALPFWEHCAFLFWYRHALPHLVPLCIGSVCVKLEVFHKGVPKLQGSIFFSAGLGGTIFKTLKGDIMSGPPRDIFPVCGECLIISMRRLGSLSFYVRTGPF